MEGRIKGGEREAEVELRRAKSQHLLLTETAAACVPGLSCWSLRLANEYSWGVQGPEDYNGKCGSVEIMFDRSRQKNGSTALFESRLPSD